MKFQKLNRRQFIRTSAVAATGTALLSPWGVSQSRAATAVKRTATDQVTLGKTGIKLSRLGFGTGVSNGELQVQDGKDAFVKMLRHALDQGITYIDTAERYATFNWIGDAIKGLPREKLFIQTKIPTPPDDVLARIDYHRKTLNTDYIDSLLVHCMTKETWTDDWKRAMDGYDQAKSKGWIRAKGVSCHTLPALKTAVASDWVETHLVRVNPEGRYMDGANSIWSRGSVDINPILEQIKLMHAKGHGIIGMKIFGNGDFKDPVEREKSIRFAMSKPEINAVVIGFTAPEQVDDTIAVMNRVLAEA